MIIDILRDLYDSESFTSVEAFDAVPKIPELREAIAEEIGPVRLDCLHTWLSEQADAGIIHTRQRDGQVKAWSFIAAPATEYQPMEPTDPFAGCRVEFRMVTPTMARELLAANTDNFRNPSKAVVASLAAAMIRGEWSFNGDTIAFDDRGVLVNGQHRLLAVIASGMTVPRDAYMTIDRQYRRRVRDDLRHQGEAASSDLASAARWLKIIHDGYGGHGSLSTVTTGQVNTIIAAWPELRHAVGIGSSLRKVTRNPGPLLAVHALTLRQYSTQSTEFFRSVVDGIGLAADAPAYLLRERLRGPADIMVNKERRSMNGGDHAALLTVTAWNLFVTGERRAILKVHPTRPALVY